MTKSIKNYLTYPRVLLQSTQKENMLNSSIM